MALGDGSKSNKKLCNWQCVALGRPVQPKRVSLFFGVRHAFSGIQRSAKVVFFFLGDRKNYFGRHKKLLLDNKIQKQHTNYKNIEKYQKKKRKKKKNIFWFFKI